VRVLRIEPQFASGLPRCGAASPWRAQVSVTVVYGGGAVGSMGAPADAPSRGGRIIGVLPQSKAELEWGHFGLPSCSW
jgi:predicted Rossmann-fold nucleotide-binding protein